MAISDEDIFNWFLANPNADDATIASTMDQFDLTPEDIARATGSDIADVQSRYDTVTGSAEDQTQADTSAQLPTFSDTVASGTSTTQDDLLSTLAGDSTDTATTTATQLPTFSDTITSDEDTSEDDFLAAISSPSDNITASNVGTKSADRATSGGVSSVVEGDDIDTQISQLPEEVAHWARSADQRYMELIDDKTGAVLQREAVGDFSDLDLLRTGLSFVPGAGQILAGVNIANAVRTGDLTGALIGATGLDPSLANVNTALRVGQAVDSGNTLGAITALAGNKDLQSLTGADTANVGGFTAKDAMAGANLIKAADTGNYGGVISNLGTLAGSSDAQIAGRAITIITRLENGDTRALNDAINLSNSISGNKATTGATNTALQLAGLDTGTVSDAGNGFTLTDADGSSLNFPDFSSSDSINADADLFNSSIGDLDATGTDTTTGNITDTTGLDTGDVIPTGDDVPELVVTDKGDKTDTTTIDTIVGGDGNDLVIDDKGEVVIKDKKESCPVGTVLNPETGECDAVEDKGEVVIKDKKESCPVGTVLNPETGECDAVEDKGEVVIKDKKESCPVGTVLNPETGECDVVEDKGEIVIKDKKDFCPVGTVLNPETGECDPVDETITCPPGKVLNEAGTACIDEVVIKDKKDFCPVGTVLNPETGECDPVEDKKTLDCPEGYEPNDAGTACIPIIEIKDKKCDPGYVYDEDLKQCVAIEDDKCLPGYHMENGVCVPDEVKCETGYHLENGVCVPDEVKCETGYHLEDGKCVKDTLQCPEGYELNDAGTECIPIVVIKDKKCDPGFVYDEDLKQCVPVGGDECAPGFHRDDATGLCVPDDDGECKDGYEKVNGTCVPVCKEGYIRNLATGVCEKVEDKGCPPGQVKDANGKCVPITKTTECQPGYERIDGVCVPKCKAGYQRVNGVCVPIATYTPTTSALPAEGEKIDPIYAEGMDEFDLFATLEELLKENSDKTDKKKDSKKSKEKTKMATGGHLDDLLAEQMTVDDLLKLLR